MDIPSGFETEILMARQLEAQLQRDPQAIVLLIDIYEQIIRRLQPEEAPIFYARTQFCLGLAYSELPIGDRTANLQQAIAHYEEALRVWTPQISPELYATVQTHLGIVYSNLSAGDRTANLQQAIAHYEEALRVWTAETPPELYAHTQYNLGLAYSELPTGDRTANLQRAITCYQEALRFWTPQTAPFEYADTQYNLGSTYSQLPTEDHTANLQRAIAHYEEALRFWTAETAPLKYVEVQYNMGVAYWKLPTGDRTANLQRAIAYYEGALRFRTLENAPLDYAHTQICLGDAYNELQTGDHTVNLQRAIAHYEEALRFWTAEAAPLEYARVQNNLGLAYSKLPTGDRTANLQQAIACYREALRFQTPETAHFEYAQIQYNLGLAYSKLLTGDRAGNLEQAIACYQKALRFWVAEINPFGCRIVSSQLADLYFKKEEWPSAFNTYLAAIEAGERLYHAGLSTESKMTELAENSALYRHAAFAAVRCGKTAEALPILERGKTRLLTEALRLRISRPPNVPDEIWSEFEQAGTAVRTEQAEKAHMDEEMRDLIQAYEAHVQAVQAASAALATAIEHVRTFAPHFLEAMDLSTVEAQFSDEYTALIAFCITEQGSLGFVVSRRHLQVVEIPTFTNAELRHHFVEVNEQNQAIGGWLGDYHHYRLSASQTDLARWQATMTRTLAALGQRLLAPILSTLSSDVERIIFLPSAELFLFPLHAVPLSGSESKLLCDHYQVSYAPSIEVLVDVRAKVKQEVMPYLYAVINPEEDPRLLFTPIEGAAIAQLFAQRTVDAGRDGTKERVLAGAQGRTYVHFACHGSYDWNDPPASGLNLANDCLTLAELQQGEVDLSAARLVTLSACETGITDVLRGSADEYVGVPAGFLLAGAPCVVSSLWAVPDLSTALLMERFYQSHLESKMDFAPALHEAQRWVRAVSIAEVARYAERCYRQSGRKHNDQLYASMRHYNSLAKQNPALRPFAHPYYWAAFTVNGL